MDERAIAKPDQTGIVPITWQSRKAKESSISNQVVARLKSALKMGWDISDACRYADISRSMYYRAIRQNQDLAEELADAEAAGLRMAHKTVQKSLRDENVDTAKWYITKRDKRFQFKHEYQGIKNQQNNIQFVITDGRDIPLTKPKDTDTK